MADGEKEMPVWGERLLITTRFELALRNVMRDWPTDGASTKDHECRVEDEFGKWYRAILQTYRTEVD